VAGETAAIWHQLLEDYTLVAEKLEQLGFTYYGDTVTVSEYSVEPGNV
jgi:trans-2-enoyl-CoA reductase